MKTKLIVIKFILIIFSTCSVFSAKLVRNKDINQIMNNFFEYHIDAKKLDARLLKRVIRLYIQNFDYEKIYLLQKEILPFYNISNEEAEKLVKNISKGDFTYFRNLEKILQNSIRRSRKIRISIEKELIANYQSIKPKKSKYYSSYCSKERHIKRRFRRKISNFFCFYQKREVIDSKEKRDKIFFLLEKKMRRFENSYLYEGSNSTIISKDLKEHYFYVHFLKAFAKSLDAHTSFFTEEEALDMRMSLEKQFDGLGVVLSEGLDGVIISGLIKGGPAEKSGRINVNDIIFEIDGQNITKSDFDGVMKLMKKDIITLGIKRVNSFSHQEVFRIKLNKAPISMDDERLSYSYSPCGDGIIGILNLPSFYENSEGISSEKDIIYALDNLKKYGNIKGLVLDLRDNSGGFLTQAVKVVGLFIDNGVVVISKYSNGEIKYIRNFSERKKIDCPVIVLTSKLSASASEIVAQSLQDYGVALIAGDERTFGKGTIQYQTVTDERADTFFKVTIGKYYTVSGRTTQIEGVKADIIVPTDVFHEEIGERFLDYPLKRDRVESAFSDNFLDLDSSAKWWFKNNYVPNMQKEVLTWKKMLPNLRKNSKQRISLDQNYQLFLEGLKTPMSSPVNPRFGQQDLQLKEGVDILKDMIIIKKSQK